MIKSICVVRLSALGDVLMFVPLVRTLQANLPDASITWVISPPAYDLVAGMDGVEFIVINKPNNLADYWRFKKQLKGRKFDVLLASQASFRANLLYPLIRAPRKIGYDKIRAKDGHHWVINETIASGQDHTLDGFLKFASALGIEKKELRWDLPISQADHAWARAHLPASSPILVVNPAASKPERSWPLERYVEVIKEAQKRWQVQVVLTGGPSDYDRTLANEIMKQVACTDLVGKTKPKQLLAVISHAHAVLCPDTGPSHMGAAVGTPVVALHAVTSAEVSGPYTFRHLAVDCYPEAVSTILNKTAETNTWGTHAHGEETMKLIKVDAVLAKLESLFLKNDCL
ncbi:glycosyltransferase family 9 protein [Legionella maceachernii]|uniref:Heptosyl transferase, glycosyltransferase family 9 protein n=1 Tax=Legionella maceachernii TaxID=466 RepID=A0A0W0VZ49_9GAMM|nr:glycosyltransferase family 9 protein [Legionella maceachernii]KTD25543.1 heptosyl transferase, glycosyltransferase family 9 protein [Legionella maceachernii]SJZ55734.1 heptosyltransferase I [Legionella maceachernii]SUP00457.1 Lipopolysaccharide core heptosyltransferase rfaQ [Legionella maceachernii]